MTFVAFEKGREILENLWIQEVLGGEVLGRRPEKGVLLGHEICGGRFSRIRTGNGVDIAREYIFVTGSRDGK